MLIAIILSAFLGCVIGMVITSLMTVAKIADLQAEKDYIQSIKSEKCVEIIDEKGKRWGCGLIVAERNALYDIAFADGHVFSFPKSWCKTAVLRRHNDRQRKIEDNTQDN